MADAKWYYSQADQEQGPVSQSQLRKLAKDGKLADSDLIWCEGMDDWEPAGNVAELKGAFAAAPGPRLGAVLPTRRSAARGGDLTAAGKQFLTDLGGDRRRLAQWLLIPGILLVLTARGCDGLGRRNVQRLKAKFEATSQHFEDTWELKSIEVRQEIDTLKELRGEIADEFRERPDTPSVEARAEFNRQLKEVDDEVAAKNDQLQEIAGDQEKERKVLVDGKWRSLNIAARDADRNNAMWAYWRELLFVLGSQLLTVGLLLMGFYGQGPERWICLVMLAIITFSLYVGGAAWVSSLPGIAAG